MDIIVAQGSEAGGHRVHFSIMAMMNHDRNNVACTGGR